jgi:cytochrome P450
VFHRDWEGTSVAQNLMAAAEGFDPALLDPPWAFHEQLRCNAPVFEVPGLGFYLVTKYEDVSAVLKDDATFSNRFPGMFGTGLSFAPATPAKEAAHAKGYRWEPTLFFSDAPEHRRHRNVLQQAFSPRRVRQLESMVQALCDEILDGLDTSAVVDLATELAFELPTMVIGEAVGVERQDRARFRRWADAVVRRLGEQLDEAGDIELIDAYVEAQNYFAAEITARRRAPRDDLLSDIVHATLDGEDPLTLEELLAIVTILPVAGTETSAGLIGMTLLHLLEQPELMGPCRRDPAFVESVIEETLRFESPIQAWFRRATTDTELSGVPVPRDAMLLVVIASANRDEQKWRCPAEFDTGRPDIKDHLAFGRGRHFCIGSNLARAEARIAIRTLLDRFDTIQLAGEPKHRTNIVHRMLESLPVRLSS